MAIEIIDGFNLSKSGALDRRTVAANQTERLALTWLYKGLLCYQVDINVIFKYIGIPNSNTVGDWDTVLDTGPAGTPGSVWYNASGIPSGGLGVDGDYYLNDTNGDVYQKQTGTWILILNLTGPSGTSGVGAGDYASLRVIGGASGQSIGATFVKCNQFTINGPNSGAVPDHTTDSITINSPGSYFIFFNGEWLTSSANQFFEFQLRLGGVDIPNAFMTTSYSGGSNTSENLSLLCLVEIDALDVPADLELFIRSTSGTYTLTALTAGFGIAGLNIKGDVGDPGKALVHLEHDINLTDAKVTAVQSGGYTIRDPYSASVLNDTRTSFSIPAQLSGSKVDHSISYDGTNWFDNGIWRGPSGPTGAPGAAGTPGAPGIPGQGTKMVTLNYTSSGNYTLPTEPASATPILVTYQVFLTGPAGTWTLTLPPTGTGNVFYRIILNSGDQTNTVVITNLIQSSTGLVGTNQTLPEFYDYSVIASNVRLTYILEPQPGGYYQLTFPGPYSPPTPPTPPFNFPKASGLNFAAFGGTVTSGFTAGSVGQTAGIKVTTVGTPTFIYNASFYRPKATFSFWAFSNGTDKRIAIDIYRSPSTLIKTHEGVSKNGWVQFTTTMIDTTAVTGSASYYARLRLIDAGEFYYRTGYDYTIEPSIYVV